MEVFFNIYIMITYNYTKSIIVVLTNYTEHQIV